MIFFSKVSGILRLGLVGGVGEVIYLVRVNSSNSCDIYEDIIVVRMVYRRVFFI